MAIYWAFMFLVGLVFCQGPDPEISTSSRTVTAREGTTAILPCTIKFKGQYKTFWLGPYYTILSLEDRRIINDPRISLERHSVDEWNLHIRSVTQTDQGQYECIINTDPVRRIAVDLVVTGTDVDIPAPLD